MNAPAKPAKIYWKDDEYQRFYAAAQTFGPPVNGDSTEVYHKAQELAGVRKKPFDPSVASKMNAYRRKHAVAALSKGNGAAASPAPALSSPTAPGPVKVIIPAPSPAVPAPAPASAISPQALAAEFEPLPDQMGAADLMVNMLLKVIYSPPLRAALRSLITETLAPENELEQLQAITWRTARTPRERQLRVVVVGGFGYHQADPIPGIEMRRWGADPGESLHRLKALLDGADVAVVAVNRVPHPAMYSVKAREKAGRLRAIYWEKGLQELRPVLIDMVQSGAHKPNSH